MLSDFLATEPHKRPSHKAFLGGFTDFVSDWSLPIMILDKALCFVYANKAYLSATHRSWGDLEGHYVFEAFPDTPDRVKNVKAIFSKTFEGIVTNLEAQPYILKTSEGQEELHYWQATQEPVFNENGEVTHFVQYTNDVTAQIVAEKEKQLMSQELLHRTKNMLSVIQSVARLSSRGHDSVEAFKQDFLERISAISRNHERLYHNDFKGASLHEILEDELQAMSDKSEQAFELTGEDVLLDAGKARDVSMIVHELATNAVKYGCFSKEAGKLFVKWTHEHEKERTDIIWEETGVGPIQGISHSGFGTRLLTLMKGIACERAIGPDGVIVQIKIDNS